MATSVKMFVYLLTAASFSLTLAVNGNEGYNLNLYNHQRNGFNLNSHGYKTFEHPQVNSHVVNGVIPLLNPSGSLNNPVLHPMHHSSLMKRRSAYYVPAPVSFHNPSYPVSMNQPMPHQVPPLNPNYHPALDPRMGYLHPHVYPVGPSHASNKANQVVMISDSNQNLYSHGQNK